MHLVVQIITVEWTKKSRGAPQSATRNSIPESLPIIGYSPADNAIQTITFTEFNSFKSPRNIWRNDLNDSQFREHGLSFEKDGADLNLGYWGSPFRVSRQSVKILGTLKHNSYFRICTNGRIAWEDTWAYRKAVYNIAYTKHIPASDLFTKREPKEEINELVKLY